MRLLLLVPLPSTFSPPPPDAPLPPPQCLSPVNTPVDKHNTTPPHHHCQQLLIGGEALADGAGDEEAAAAGGGGGAARGGAAAARRCSPNNVASPERSEYLAGNLLILETASNATTGARESVLWAFDTESQALTKVLAAPRGAELTGVGAQRAGGAAYITVALQLPPASGPKNDGGRSTAPGQEAGGGAVGYIGPLPLAVLDDGAALRFEGLARDAPSPAAGGAPLAAARACVAPRAPAAAAAAGPNAGSAAQQPQQPQQPQRGQAAPAESERQ